MEQKQLIDKSKVSSYFDNQLITLVTFQAKLTNVLMAQISQMFPFLVLRHSKVEIFRFRLLVGQGFKLIFVTWIFLCSIY